MEDFKHPNFEPALEKSILS